MKIPVDVLPEQLRGKSEAEIRFILNQGLEGMRRANEENKTLKQQLAELKNKPKEPEKPAEPQKPLEERILEDPEGVIAEIVSKRFGGTIQSLEQQTGEVAFDTVKRDPRFEDFEEYEEDIRNMLQEAQAPMTKQNIMGAYTMAVGQKALLERQRKGREQVQGIEQGGPPPAEEDTPKVEGIEREIMIASGFTDEKEWMKYKNTGSVADQIRVPDGKRKEQNNG